MSEEAAIREDVANEPDAIHEDVSDGEKKPVSDRDERLAEMAKKRKAALEAEIGVEPEPEPEPEPDVPEMVDLKVDGKVIQRSRQDVEAAGGVAALQKQIAVETRLEQAAAERREVERLRQETERRARELEQREAALAQKQQSIATVAEDEAKTAEEIVAGLYSGDEDQAKEALAKFLARNKSAPPAPQVKAPSVDDVLFEVERREGNRLFNEQYSHLASDQRLWSMTQQTTARMFKENPKMSPREIILAAAKEVDDWSKGMSAKGPDLMAEQQQRKKSINPVPTAHAKGKAETGYKPKTPAEIMAEMRANRSR